MKLIFIKTFSGTRALFTKGKEYSIDDESFAEELISNGYANEIKTRKPKEKAIKTVVKETR